MSLSLNFDRIPGSVFLAETLKKVKKESIAT